MYKEHFVSQNIDLVSYAFKKCIPSDTNPTFQEVGRVTQPLTFKFNLNILYFNLVRTLK